MVIPYKLATLAQVNSSLILTLPLMFDTESNDLYKPIKLAQFYQEGWHEVLLVKNPDINELMVLLNKTLIILQNASYDITTIQKQSNTRYIPENFHDVLLLGRLHWYKDTSFSLDRLMLNALGYDPYVNLGLTKKDMQKSKWDNISEEQYIYAAIDVYYLPQVWNACKEFITDQNYELDLKTLKYCLDMQNNGFPVNLDKRMELEKKNTKEIEELGLPINANSYKQVREYIGKDESDALALATYSIEGNEKASKVNETRKLLKQNSFLKKFNVERITGIFSPTARSGRLTCRKQNLQQLPRKTKSVFGYLPSNNRVFVYSDFSQLELRTACAVIGEKAMARLFYKNADLHTYTQNRMNIIHPQARQIAKTCNFNLLYGGSAKMLGEILIRDAGIMFSHNKLIKLKKTWQELWPEIFNWQMKGINEWEKGNACSTVCGRRYVGKLMTDYLNIEIQGAGADVAKHAFCSIMHGLPSINKDAIMCNFIHDSFFIECPDDPTIYKSVSELIATSMTNAWSNISKYFKIKDIPMPVKVIVGKNWEEIEDNSIPNIYEYTTE